MAMLEGIAEEKPELPVLGGVDLDASAAELEAREALASLRLRLPPDWQSEDFVEGLASIRETQFSAGERTLFNSLVCEELARRGEPPNSANVLRCGRWGSTVAVAADVRAWYSRLASEIASRQPEIPDGARRAANALLEQMWAIAYGNARSPLVDELAAVRAELEAERLLVKQRTSSLEQLQVAYGGLAEQVRALQGQLDEARRIHQIDLLDAEKQVQTLQSAAAEKERLFQAELAAERQRGDQMATRHEEAMAQARQAHQAALDRMDRQLEAEAQRAATERTGLEQRLEVAQADVRQWTTATLAAQADVQRLTQDLGQIRLELAGAKSEVVELTKLAEEQKVTVYGMASDLEKARERDAAVWLPRLKEFGLRLEREPEAELARPSWLDADVWERSVLPMVSPARGDRTFRAD
jgi:hypothetical protein